MLEEIAKLINRESFSNIVRIKITDQDEFLNCRGSARCGADRFLKASSLLTPGEILGWQFHVGKDKDLSSYMFSSCEASPSIAAYYWISEKCADSVEEIEREDGDEFKEGNIFILMPGEGKDCDKLPYCDENYYIRLFDSIGKCLKWASDSGGADIFILSGTVKNTRVRSSTVLLSLSGELPLHIRTSLSMVFPSISLARVGEDLNPPLKGKQLPLSLMSDLTTGLIYAIMTMDHKTEMKDKQNEKPLPLVHNHIQMLNELIGLEKVKEHVRKITAYARLKKDMEKKGWRTDSLVLNMEFVGNPGTAKTTVARILAGIFHETGLLSSSSLIEVGRADLVAKYEGQTAAKVRDVFQRAKGKTLFIDEAYSLVEAWENNFGDEAISTIVQEMENNSSDTIVIFAGYPYKMDELFFCNPGLRSRVPFRIVFDDYTAEEMEKIVVQEAKKKGFAIKDEAAEKVTEICRTAGKIKNSGNGRFCRNLVDRAILTYAERLYGEECSTNVPSDLILTSLDFSPELLPEKPVERVPLGFSTK